MQPNTEERHNRGGDYKKYSVFMLTSDPSQLFNIAFLTTIDSEKMMKGRFIDSIT